MFTLRCTQKLLARLRAAPDQERADAATTRLGNWYANLLYLPREQVVLFVNERSLLPVVVPARDARSLTARMQHTLRDVLLRIGVPAEAVEAELGQMREVQVAKTSSRAVLGSMTDFTIMLRVGRRPRSLLDESLDLSEAPCGPLRMRSPRRVALELLSAPPEINPGPKEPQVAEKRR